MGRRGLLERCHRRCEQRLGRGLARFDGNRRRRGLVLTARARRPRRRRFTQTAEVADLVDRQPVVEAFAPAVEVGVERLAAHPRLRAGQRQRAGLYAFDRDVPFLFERRRRLGRSSERWLLAGRRARPTGFVADVGTLADGDDVRAVLTADLEDLAANAVVADRVPRLAFVAEALHVALPATSRR